MVIGKPILTRWVKEQLDPMRNMQQMREQLPELLLATAEMPKMVDHALQSMAAQGARQDEQLREIQLIRADMLNERRRDWIALIGVAVSIAVGAQVVGWLSPVFYILAVLFVLWRLLG